MVSNKKYISIVLFLCLFFIFGCENGGAGSKDASHGQGSDAPAGSEVKEYVEVVGDRALPFTITTFSGDTFNLADTLGSPVVINLWASWCGPCKYEAPELQSAYEMYKDRGVFFVGVALQDSVNSSIAFVEHFGWTFPTGPDETGYIMKTYRAMAIPMTYIIDQKGLVSYIHVGAIDVAVIERELDRLL